MLGVTTSHGVTPDPAQNTWTAGRRMTDDLNRFVEAQDSTFEDAIDEITSGLKQTHWMWFVFPQLRGLGLSEKSMFYGIRNVDEARRYLAHPILGPRLEKATRCVLEGNVPARDIFGEVDYQKFVSCMTLFNCASAANSVFYSALCELCTLDERTIQMLGDKYDSL